MLRLSNWFNQVESELKKRRLAARRNNPNGIPKSTQSPGGVQWYQEWTGPHRWITCEVLAQRPNTVTAAFWTQPDWERRDERIVAMDDDTTAFANDVWEFLKPAD